MKEKLLYAVWAAFYILCVGLGFIQEPEGLGKAVLVLIAIGFFVPGGILLYDGIRSQNRKAVKRVRIICLLSLGLTLGMLLLNLVSFAFPETWGEPLYELLLLVSAPMICGQYWVMSMFLWACLLFATFVKLPKEK